MKYAILTALMVAGLKTFSQTNTDSEGYVTNAALLTPFTFKKDGHAISNAVLVKLTGSKFIYKTPDGGEGMQALYFLPNDLQIKFGYNPSNAFDDAVADIGKKDRDQAAFEKQQLDAAGKAQQDAIWQTVNANRAYFAVSNDNLKVNQITQGGVLASYDHESDEPEHEWSLPYFVKDCPNKSSLTDGDFISGPFYKVGNYSYTTVMGSGKTIPCVTCSPYAAFAYYSTNGAVVH